MTVDQATLSTWKPLYRLGGICAFLQLFSISAYAVIMTVLGPKPETAREYFTVYRSSPLEAFLRGDFLLLVLIGLYLGTFPALYIALREQNPPLTLLSLIGTLLAVILTFANESTFSLLYLGEKYLSAGKQDVRQIIAAGQAVIASDMWHSSGAYMSGFLLQGTGVLISTVMLRSPHFSRVTALSGLIGNGLDLVQHLIHPFLPEVSTVIALVMGVFYLVWFPALGRDLIRISGKTSRESATALNSKSYESR